ncbi:hypothetical protein PVK06_046792 [Gossypium arboreum]|uniref:Uncharacterized protein n=1 Tax=Gossypium arboreum TaxID=29729 RepID=A0ABR0MBM4_GOSAR|nr:hypothetical protein PVK06_046792 [Gossypium arboreum]
MVVRSNGEIESKEEKNEEFDATANEEKELEYTIDGKIIVIKRSLNLQSMENEQERENIFHTRCHVQSKAYKYTDEVLYNVVPMHASHLLLGRLWQFDRKGIYDGYTNRYTFKHLGKNVTLAPLMPRQVYEDQLKLRDSVKKFKENE